MKEKGDKKRKSYSGWILFLFIITGLTLPFHWSLDYETVFPKEHLTFSNTFFTSEDVTKIIERYNDANFIERQSISQEPFIRKLMEKGIIIEQNNDNQNKSDIKINQDYSHEDVIELSAKTLYTEYEMNEVAANNKYKGKIIMVTGEIHEITSTEESYAVKLDGGGWVGLVVCYFSDKHKFELSHLSKGEEVSIVGECNGKDFFYPELLNCSIEGELDRIIRLSNRIQRDYIDKAIAALSTRNVIIYNKVKNHWSRGSEEITIYTIDFEEIVNEVTSGYLNSPYGNGGWKITSENLIETYGGIDHAKMWHEWKIKIILYPDFRFKSIEAEWCSDCEDLDSAEYVTYESWEFVYN